MTTSVIPRDARHRRIIDFQEAITLLKQNQINEILHGKLRHLRRGIDEADVRIRMCLMNSGPSPPAVLEDVMEANGIVLTLLWVATTNDRWMATPRNNARALIDWACNRFFDEATVYPPGALEEYLRLQAKSVHDGTPSPVPGEVSQLFEKQCVALDVIWYSWSMALLAEGAWVIGTYQDWEEYVEGEEDAKQALRELGVNPEVAELTEEQKMEIPPSNQEGVEEFIEKRDCAREALLEVRRRKETFAGNLQSIFSEFKELMGGLGPAGAEEKRRDGSYPASPPPPVLLENITYGLKSEIQPWFEAKRRALDGESPTRVRPGATVLGGADPNSGPALLLTDEAEYTMRLNPSFSWADHEQWYQANRPESPKKHRVQNPYLLTVPEEGVDSDGESGVKYILQDDGRESEVQDTLHNDHEEMSAKMQESSEGSYKFSEVTEGEEYIDSQSITRSGSPLGSYHYDSPEENVDARSKARSRSSIGSNHDDSLEENVDGWSIAMSRISLGNYHGDSLEEDVNARSMTRPRSSLGNYHGDSSEENFDVRSITRSRSSLGSYHDDSPEEGVDAQPMTRPRSSLGSYHDDSPEEDFDAWSITRPRSSLGSCHDDSPEEGVDAQPMTRPRSSLGSYHDNFLGGDVDAWSITMSRSSPGIYHDDSPEENVDARSITRSESSLGSYHDSPEDHADARLITRPRGSLGSNQDDLPEEDVDVRSMARFLDYYHGSPEEEDYANEQLAQNEVDCGDTAVGHNTEYPNSCELGVVGPDAGPASPPTPPVGGVEGMEFRPVDNIRVVIPPYPPTPPGCGRVLRWYNAVICLLALCGLLSPIILLASITVSAVIISITITAWLILPTPIARGSLHKVVEGL